MIDKTNDALRFHQSVLDMRAFRQQVLASNIANADTPHYKARDIDFKSALQSALAGSATPAFLTRTSPRHLQPASAGLLGAKLLFRSEQQSSVDGNTVNLDVERAQFAENAVHYEASLTFVGSYLRQLQTAIQGQ